MSQELRSDDEWVNDALGFADLSEEEPWTYVDALEEIRHQLDDPTNTPENALDTLRSILALAYAGVREGTPVTKP